MPDLDLVMGRPYRELVRFYAEMPVATLLVNCILATLQLITVAMAIQWLIGMTFYSPVV